MTDLTCEPVAHLLAWPSGDLFTGTAFRLADAGWVLYEQDYCEGLQSGPGREWYGPDRLCGECGYLSGVLHGIQRQWWPDGRLSREAEYDRGRCLWQREWDRDGNLIRNTVPSG